MPLALPMFTTNRGTKRNVIGPMTIIRLYVLSGPMVIHNGCEKSQMTNGFMIGIRIQ